MSAAAALPPRPGATPDGQMGAANAPSSPQHEVFEGNHRHCEYGPATPTTPPLPSSSSSSSSSSSLVAFISGGVGGACSVLLGHPLDLVKVRMQTATTTTTTAAGGGVGSAATTVSGMLAEIVRAEGGARGLFRGVGAPLLTVVPTTAVAFWGYDVGRRTIASFDGDRPDRAPSGAEVCAAGAMSAFPTALVIVPTERVKCLLQVQRGRGGVVVGGGTRYYSGTIDCARRLLEEGGIRSLYRGTGATLARGVPGTMAYFAAYEATKGAMTGVVDRRDGPGGGGGDGGRPLSPVAVLIAGGIAGVAYWACVVPIIADVIKSRIQTAPPGSYPRGYADVYASVVKEGGHAGLFRGFVPAVMRAIPASMARSLGMEVTRKILE